MTNVTFAGHILSYYAINALGRITNVTAVFHGPAFTNTACVATDEVTVAIGTPACSYDPNGNMTEDSRSWYYYDLADRLIRVVSKETSNTVLECSYDGLGRRREVTRDGTDTERYVYLPGTFLVLAVLDETDTIKEIYTYGPDLSGTLSGAGGVGGILGGVDFIESVTNAMHSDALGNIVMLTDGDGAVAAVYQYGPFGKITGQTGTRSSRFMFSSKEYDPEAGLCYFGYRLYDPQRGQWINRDLIGEQGGINLYGFVRNTPVNLIDLYGLQEQDQCCPNGHPIDCDALKEKIIRIQRAVVRRIDAMQKNPALSRVIEDNENSFSYLTEKVTLSSGLGAAFVTAGQTIYANSICEPLTSTYGIPLTSSGLRGDPLSTRLGQTVWGVGAITSIIGASFDAKNAGEAFGAGDTLMGFRHSVSGIGTLVGIVYWPVAVGSGLGNLTSWGIESFYDARNASQDMESFLADENLLTKFIMLRDNHNKLYERCCVERIK